MPQPRQRPADAVHPIQLELIPQVGVALQALRPDWSYAHLLRTACADTADGIYQPWWQASRDGRRRRALDRSLWTTRNTTTRGNGGPRWIRLELTQAEVDALKRVRPEWPLARIVRHVLDDLCAGLYQPAWATGPSPFAPPVGGG